MVGGDLGEGRGRWFMTPFDGKEHQKSKENKKLREQRDKEEEWTMTENKINVLKVLPKDKGI